MIATLIRVEESDQGTVGVLTLDGIAKAVTLEPPDRDNRANVSCIPAGSYLCRAVRSPRFGDTFEVTDVPGRSHILFHAGNTVADTLGCILLAEKFGKLRGERAVLNSGVTFKAFLEYLALHGVEEFELRIIDAAGGAA